MSGDRGRPEVSAIPSNRSDQPVADGDNVDESDVLVEIDRTISTQSAIASVMDCVRLDVARLTTARRFCHHDHFTPSARPHNHDGRPSPARRDFKGSDCLPHHLWHGLVRVEQATRK
jgi:hypothetical protein